jgi:short-subunit dehydrogenase
MNDKTKYALITGASSGIGLELAQIAAQEGMNLILLARNAEKLMQIRTEIESLYPVRVLAVGCDLTGDDAVEKIAAMLASRSIVPDVLINCAGFGIYAPFEHIGTESEDNLIQLNIRVLTELTKVFYRQMRTRGSGRIMNVASFAAFMPGPYMAVYHASKAYVLMFSEALAAESRGSGVSVTALCPAPTVTGFEGRAARGGDIRAFSKFGKLPTAVQVATYGWRSMMRGRTVAVHGRLARWLIFLIRLLPRAAVVRIACKMQKP